MVGIRRESDGRVQDMVRDYLNRIGAVPLLTQAEEIRLAKRIEAGVFAAELLRTADGQGDLPGTRAELRTVVREGELARARMVQANLRLVVAAARDWTGSRLPLSDLIQEGNLGLIHAVAKFDYRKGFKFATYAMWWIKQAIRRGIAAQGRMIRLPVHAEETLSMLDRAAKQAMDQHGRLLTVVGLAELAGVPVARAAALLRYRSGTVSLDEPIGDRSGGTLGDVIEDSEASAAFEEVEQRVVAADLHALVDTLPAREASAVRMRFGLLDGEPWPLRRIAEAIGVSGEGARQLVRNAVKRLRKTGRAAQAA